MLKYNPLASPKGGSKLADYYTSLSSVWLVYFKKVTGQPSVTYVEAVEDALCSK